jgi:hypothetical protein
MRATCVRGSPELQDKVKISEGDGRSRRSRGTMRNRLRGERGGDWTAGS